MRHPKIRVFVENRMLETEVMLGSPDGVAGIEEGKGKLGATVMMSTGVRDLDGKEIFEGDICERMCGDKLCEDKHIGIVEYDDQDGSYVIANPKKGLAWPMVASIFASDGRNIVGKTLPKVLGNGYESPALYKLL